MDQLKERCIYCGSDVYYTGTEVLIKCGMCGHTLVVAKFENELVRMNQAIEEGETAKKKLEDAEKARDHAKARLEKAMDALEGIHISQRNVDKALSRIANDFSKNKEEQKEMKKLLIAIRGRVNTDGDMISHLFEMVSQSQQARDKKFDTLQMLADTLLKNQNNMLAAMAVLPQLSEKLSMSVQQQNQLAGSFMTWFQNIRQEDVNRLKAISESTRALNDRQKLFEEKIALLQRSAADIQSMIDGFYQEYNRDKLEKISHLYHQAENEQKDREFDKAYETYKIVLAEGHEVARDAEVYWRMLMCHYGLTYEKSAEGKMIPIILIPDLGDPEQMSLRKELRSCLRSQEPKIKKYYEEQLSEIDGILDSYRHLRLETEYDVFISVKQTDEFGRYTADSDKASDLFDFLTSRGVNVFNSRRTLRAGEIYEPRIIAALMSARVMIVVGSSAENMNSNWVRNEWSRYTWLQKRENDSLKTLLCYLTGDMDPYRIPKGLNPDRQAIVDGINAQEDLLTALKDIIPDKDSGRKAVSGSTYISGDKEKDTAYESVNTVLDQMTVWLMLSEYEKVLNKYKQIKAEPPYLYEPTLHLYALCAEKKVDEIEDLTRIKIDLEKEKLFKLAMKLCKENDMKEKLLKLLEANHKWNAVQKTNEMPKTVKEKRSDQGVAEVKKVSPEEEATEKMYQIGVTAEREQNYSLALFCYQRAARSGHIFAQHALGCHYYKGDIVEKDLKQAIYWYEKAGEQGFYPSQFILMRYYEREKDLKQEAYWRRKGAEQGVSSDQLWLGEHYENGNKEAIKAVDNIKNKPVENEQKTRTTGKRRIREIIHKDQYGRYTIERIELD